MRMSRYTVAVEGEAGERLLYHTANGAFAVLGKQTSSTLAALETAEAVADASAVAGALAEAGFLTSLAPEDELAVLKARFTAASGNLDRLALSIAPTYACNCRCAYCYEQDKEVAAGVMGADVQAAVLAFARERYAVHPFSRLSVQWYGGEPSLALDVVESLSDALISWCDETGIAYDAMMLSNCVRIDDAAAALLAHCRVGSVLVTIDGPRDIHNIRRPAAEGGDAFGCVMGAIDALFAHGVRVEGMINVDKVTMPLYAQLRGELAAHGASLAPTKLNDYAHTFGKGRFAPPDFDLFTHEEFHRAQCDAFLAQEHEAGEFRDLLRPVCRFCEGQRMNYFVVDCRGDVYCCDGWMGDRSRAVGNLVECGSCVGLDSVSDAVSFDPFACEECSACKLLPQCWGNCSWERERCGWPCHPFKETLHDYLRAWRRCFGMPGDFSAAADAGTGAGVPGGFALLAPPLSEEEIIAAERADA